MRSFTINKKGVLKLLKDLNPHKAQVPDAIPSCFLKECSDGIAPALTLVYQASIQQGTIPDDWKKALVTPIFKKGDKSDPANYRPISFTSICCKTMEHIIHSQLMQHLDTHTILCDQQQGFRKRRSCGSQLKVTIQLASRLYNLSTVSNSKYSAMIGCLQTRVCKQPILALYFEFENELKIYNLEARTSQPT